MTPAFWFLLAVIILVGCVFLRESRREREHREPLAVYVTVAFSCGVLFTLTFLPFEPLAQFAPVQVAEESIVIHAPEPQFVHDRICGERGI
jgi:FtsH-binding integral membrane protein